MFPRAPIKRFNEKKDTNYVPFSKQKYSSEVALQTAKSVTLPANRKSKNHISTISPCTKSKMEVKESGKSNKEDYAETSKQVAESKKISEAEIQTQSVETEANSMLSTPETIMVDPPEKTCDFVEPKIVLNDCVDLPLGEEIIIKDASVLGNTFTRVTEQEITNNSTSKTELTNYDETEFQESTVTGKGDAVTEVILKDINSETEVYNATTSQTAEQLLHEKILDNKEQEPSSLPEVAMEINESSYDSQITVKSEVPNSELQEIKRLETSYNNRRKKFLSLMKELQIKQKVVMDSYNSLTSLRGKLHTHGRKVQNVQNIHIFELGDFEISANDEMSETTCLASCHFEGAGEELNLVSFERNSDSINFIKKLISSISAEIVKQFEDCYTKISVLLSWVEDHSNTEEELKELESFKKTSMELYTHMDTIIKNQENYTSVIVNTLKNLWKGHEEMKKLNEELVLKGKQNVEEIEFQKNANDLLVKENLDLKEKLSCKDSKIEQMENEMKDAHANNNSIQCKLNDSIQLVEDLRMKLKNVTLNNKKLTSKLKTVQMDFKKKEDEHKRKTEELLETVTHSSKFASKLEIESSEKILAMEEVVRSEKSRALEAKQEVLTLQNKFNEISEKLSEEQKKRKDTEKELEEFQEKIKSLEDQNTVLESLIETQKAESIQKEITYNKNTETLSEELENTKVVLQAAKCKVSSLEKELQEFMNGMKQSSDAITQDRENMAHELEMHIKEKDQQILTLRSQLKDLEDKTEEIDLECDSLRKQLKDTKTQISSRNEKAFKDNLSAEKSAEQQAETDVLQTEKDELESIVIELTNQNEALKYELQHKQQEIEQKEATLTHMKEILKVRDDLVNVLKTKQEQQQIQIKTLESEIQENDTMSFRTQDNELLDMQKEIEAKRQEITELGDMIRQMETEYKKAQAHRTKQEERISQLEKQLEENCIQRLRHLRFW